MAWAWASLTQVGIITAFPIWWPWGYFPFGFEYSALPAPDQPGLGWRCPSSEQEALAVSQQFPKGLALLSTV